MFYMKKSSSIRSLIIVLGALFLSIVMTQCTKTGAIAKNLDRSLPTTLDSTAFSPFYDTTIISVADAVPDVNDLIVSKGVKGIIQEYCATANCHGGPIEPQLTTYDAIKNIVTPGNPEASKLWELITTNDLNKAMPPVNLTHELSTTDKITIYNWIKNGAKASPALEDFRPTAIRIITGGCTSVNCHNEVTATGGWARKGLIPGLVSADTSQFVFTNTSGKVTVYCQLTNATLRDKIWTAYKDSVRKFYADTLVNAPYRPHLTVSTPVSALSTRGPLDSYDNLLLDINFPKSVRTNSSVVYRNNGDSFYVKGDYLGNGDCFIRRIDSTILFYNVRTGVATTKNGSMAYDDGGLTPSNVALIKAWYFADPNIPDVWKYGMNNTGIFQHRKSGTFITKQ